MKSTLLIKKEIYEAIVATNEFQRGYNAFSGVNMKSKLELNPDVARAAQPWIDKIMREAFKYLQARAETEIPGMKEKDAKRCLDYTLAHLIKCWAESEAARSQYAVLLDSIDVSKMPRIGEPPMSGILALDFPLRQLFGEYAVDPPKPVTCCICGKEKCAHLQTLLADDKEPEVIDALFDEDPDDDHG
jgi:hypothetical protein